jgi:hypothetical protein
MKSWRIVSLALMLAAGTADAQLQGPGLTLPPLDPDHSVELTPTIGLRGWVGGRTGLLASEGFVASSVVLADWYPLANGFRVTGGLAFETAQLDVPVSMSYEIDRIARASASGGVALDPRSSLAHGNPYLGVGWEIGAASRSGLYFSADLGVMYQRSSLATWGCPGGVAVGPCGAEVRSLDAAGYPEGARFAPMMSMGLGLRF